MAKPTEPKDELKDKTSTEPASEALTDDSGAMKKAEETIVGGFYIVEGVAVDCNGKPIA